MSHVTSVKVKIVDVLTITCMFSSVITQVNKGDIQMNSVFETELLNIYTLQLNKDYLKTISEIFKYSS